MKSAIHLWTVVVILALVSLSAGQPFFVEQQVISTDFFSRTPYNICIADMDTDGDPDILVGAYFGETKIKWHANLDGAGTFGPEQVIDDTIIGEMTVVHAADLDRDGDMDFIVSNDGNHIAWFENPDGTATNFEQHDLTNSTWHCNCIKTADVENDGDLDIFCVAYSSEKPIYWFENTGDGNFSSEKVIYTIADGLCESIIVDDLDNDGDPDVIGQIFQSQQVNLVYFENTGNQQFASGQQIARISNVNSMVGADMNDDSFIDIVVASDQGVKIFENNQNGFSSGRTVVSAYTCLVKPADFDQDGDMDLVWADRVDRVLWNPNQGDGTFGQSRVISNTLDTPSSLCLQDLDMDGDQDIVVGAGIFMDSESQGSIRWYQNQMDPAAVQNETSALPKAFELYHNYPNPFNPSTTIRFSLPQAGQVTLEIYNLTGQKVETLVNDNQAAGEHEITWQPHGLASGIYLARLQCGHSVKTMKLLFQN